MLTAALMTCSTHYQTKHKSLRSVWLAEMAATAVAQEQSFPPGRDGECESTLRAKKFLDMMAARQ